MDGYRHGADTGQLTEECEVLLSRAELLFPPRKQRPQKPAEILSLPGCPLVIAGVAAGHLEAAFLTD